MKGLMKLHKDRGGKRFLRACEIFHKLTNPIPEVKNSPVLKTIREPHSEPRHADSFFSKTSLIFGSERNSSKTGSLSSFLKMFGV